MSGVLSHQGPIISHQLDVTRDNIVAHILLCWPLVGTIKKLAACLREVSLPRSCFFSSKTYCFNHRTEHCVIVCHPQYK